MLLEFFIAFIFKKAINVFKSNLKTFEVMLRYSLNMNRCNFFKTVTTLLFVLSFNSYSFAEKPLSAETNSSVEPNSDLAQQLEQLKSQVLQLNRELFILEEDLLFPASTQIALFVSVDTGKFFTIDSVEVKINDKDVAGFLYTERQRKALEQGGIQKLYLGNLKIGQHQLTAIFTGVDPEGRMIKRAAEYQIEKDDETLMIELKLVDDTKTYRSQVVVEEWVL
jgi:hypothetical protein